MRAEKKAIKETQTNMHISEMRICLENDQEWEVSTERKEIDSMETPELDVMVDASSSFLTGIPGFASFYGDPHFILDT